MDLVTLSDWKYPTTAEGLPPYVPGDARGRTNNPERWNTMSPIQPNVYRPCDLVENYSSLVWKESFRPNGGFELKTYDIEETLEKLPHRTLVSLRDTDEICIVTTHHIGTNESGEDVLTVAGISLLTYILNNRPTWAYQRGSTTTVHAANVNLVFQIPDHLSFLLWGGIVFPFNEGGANAGTSFELPFNIIVPHTAVSQTMLGASKGDWYRTEWPPPVESRLESVNQVLALDQRFGIRVVRPKNMTAKIYRPNNTSLRGEGYTETESNLTKMIFDVYEGRDLTVGATRIMFQYQSGDIVSSEFLASIQDYKNVVSSHTEVPPEPVLGSSGAWPPVVSSIVWEGDEKVFSPTDFPISQRGNPKIWSDPAAMDARKYLTGLTFHMGEVDAAISIPDNIPSMPEPAVAKLRSDGLKYLKEENELDMLTADISPHTQYKYKEHYNLGDWVTVQGKYGEPQKMVVSEYTRTSDVHGINGFPTLIKWKEPHGGI